MRTKKGEFLREMLKNMTKRLPRMTRSRRVQPSSILPSSMLPTTIIEGIADELPPQSRRQSRRQPRTKTPAQRDAERKEKAAKRAELTRFRARTRANSSKGPSPEAMRISRDIAQLRTNIANLSNQAETLKAESDANAAAVMETVEKAKAELDGIEGKQGKKGGKRTRYRTHRKPKRSRK